LKALANNADDDEFSMTSEEKNNPRQLKKASKNNNFTKECEFFKKQSLDCHVITSDHQIVCAARMKSQVTLYSSFAVQIETDQIKSPYGSYQNNIAAHEFIESIGHVIEQE
ncbi:4869_t:CDS:2, partial [Dentiscutata erythropus]